MNASWADRTFQNAKLEFLRFSDIRGRSNQSQFWSYALFLAIVGIFYLLFSRLLLPLLPDDAIHIGEAIVVAPLALFVVPTLAGIVRRISDTIPARRLSANLINFSQRNNVQAIIFKIAVFVFAIASLILSAVYVPVILILSVTVFCLLPSDPVIQRTGPSASMATINRTVPPPPPSSGFSTAQLSHLPLAAASALGNSAKDSPKKSLLSRVWFWISIVSAVVLLLAIMFPGLFSQLLKSQESSEGYTSSDSPAKIQNESTPVDSPTPSLNEDSVVEETIAPEAPLTSQVDTSGLDPRFRYCTHAIAAGYGPYVNGVDPEYSWYNDRDGDGIVCER